MPIVTGQKPNRETSATTTILNQLSKYVTFSEYPNYLLKHRRTHGFQLPLHFQQIIGWFITLLFVSIFFWCLLPTFSISIQWISYATFIPLLFVYVISHFFVVFLDPVEKSLRNKPEQEITPLNRSRNSHVIENGYCNLCLIEISSEKTKHCRSCNKCVDQFDHHCKWLNQCIGQRNYVPFIMCIISATILTSILIVLVLVEMMYHIWRPQWLQKFLLRGGSDGSRASADITINNDVDPDDQHAGDQLNSTLAFFDLLLNNSNDQNNDIFFLIVISIVGILATVSAALLIHLCFFHFYITYRGLTTYEYIRANRGQSLLSNQSSNRQLAVPARKNLNYQQLRLTKSSLMLCTKNTSSTNSILAAAALTASATTSAESSSRLNLSRNSIIEHPSNTLDSPTEISRKKSANGQIVEEEPIENLHKKLRTTKRWTCCISVPDSPDEPISLTLTPRETIHDRTRWSLFKKIFHFKIGRRNNNQIAPFKASDSYDGLSHLSAYTITATNQQANLAPPAHKKIQLPSINHFERANICGNEFFDQLLLNGCRLSQDVLQNTNLNGREPANRRKRPLNLPSFRQRTPTLSPIKESGFSNPNSPSKNSIHCEFQMNPSVD